MPTTPTMRAGIATAEGVAFHKDIPRPTPEAGQILVRVAAAGLNRADLSAQRIKDGHVVVVGQEWAGEVTDVGAGVTNIKKGDNVMCFGRNGGYAEYAVTEAGWAWVYNPKEIKPQQAAVLPLALLTAHDALTTRGHLQKGQNVLVQGASSAVGMMTLQIARFKGATHIAGTSRDATKYDRLKELGATLMLNSSAPGWVDEVMKATEGKGAHVTVDMVSGKTVNDSVKATAILGYIVNVGRLGGGTAEFDFDQHAARRISYVGVTFRSRSTQEIADLTSKMVAEMMPAVRDGRIALAIDRAFKLEDAEQALSLMDKNGQFGKIVLTI
jgi:NADPH2:quinone reductase